MPARLAWSIRFRAMIWVITGGCLIEHAMTDTKQHPERWQPAKMAPWAEALLMLVGGAGIVLVMGACLTLAGAPFIASTTLISAVILIDLLFEEKNGNLLSYVTLAIGALVVPGFFVWAGAGELVVGTALRVIVVSALGLGGFLGPVLLTRLLTGLLVKRGIRISDSVGGWVVAACCILGLVAFSLGMALTRTWGH